MEDIETVVSENIQKLLDEYNLSHARLAKIAGVSVSTVGKWVLKKATPRMGSVQKISDHFNLPKSYILDEDVKTLPMKVKDYPFIPAKISAGLPIEVDGITEVEQISIPDALMGKYAGQTDIYITRINGESMNKVMQDGSLIAVKPVELHELKENDIVVYSHNHDYGVKRFFKNNNEIWFRPHSTDFRFKDDIYNEDNLDGLQIHGKVVLYIVELD